MKRLLLATMLAAIAVLWTKPVDARQLGLWCNISTTGVSFGNYSVFNPSATLAEGTITYQCLLGVLIRIELDDGQSTTFTPRVMKDGTKPALSYNLYLDSNRSTIWGNGSGSTGVLSHIVTALFTHQARVYGRIPPQQNVQAGSYSDSVTATIIF